MIGEVYSKSDLEDGIPVIVGLSTQELTATVLESPVKTWAGAVADGAYVSIHAELPYESYVHGGVLLPRAGSDSLLMLDEIFVGDRRLIGRGVGVRLVRAFVEKALEVNPAERWMHTGWIRLGAINAIEKAMPGCLRVELGKSPERHYGHDTGKSLEQMLTEHPPKEGRAFKAWSTVTKIQ